MTMVGMLVQCVTFQREIKRPASSRSQRGMMTSVAPPRMLACMTLTMPVMWNMGTTTRATFSAEPLPTCRGCQALCITLAWVCMQPLGKPVVPLV